MEINLGTYYELVVDLGGPTLLEHYEKIEDAYEAFCNATHTEGVSATFIRKVIPNNEKQEFVMKLVNVWIKDEDKLYKEVQEILNKKDDNTDRKV